MESIVVALLVVCFVLVMAPAALAGLVDADAVDREPQAEPAPLPRMTPAGTAEAEERIAA